MAIDYTGARPHQVAPVLKENLKPGTVRRVLWFAGSYRRVLITFGCVIVIDAAIGNINPLLFREIINRGVIGHDANLVVALALLAACVLLANGATGVWKAYLAARIGRDVLLKLQTDLFNHIQRMPLAFFLRAQTGALVSRLNGDITGAQSAFTDMLSSVLGNFISAATVLAFMLTLSWKITLASLALYMLFLVPARFMGRTLREMTRESYNITSAINGLMTERFSIAGALLVKLFGRPENEARLFYAKARALGDLSMRRSVYSSLFFSVLTLMGGLAAVLAFGWGGSLAVKGELDVGTLVALISYLARLYAPLTGLSNIQISIMTAFVSFDRVFEILDLVPTISEKADAIDIPRGPATVVFSHVAFQYPTPAEVSLASLEAVARPNNYSERLVLRDIDFVAPAGSITALVGPSGAGKTTITLLMCRLYDITAGAITIDGIDIRAATKSSLRNRIGVITQDAHLFDDTLRANLLYARPDATDAEIWAALEAAQIKSFVETLVHGLETVVGEKGYRLSGGERQRIAVARLLLRDPDIVILDEATAHLDSENEAVIQQAFEEARSGRTAIVVAHRLSTVVKAHQILVLDGGRIVELGNHEELLSRGGLYARLYNQQFGANRSTVRTPETSFSEHAPA